MDFGHIQRLFQRNNAHKLWPLTEALDKCNVTVCTATGQIPRSTERILVE